LEPAGTGAPEARHAIQQGYRLYAVSPSTGVEVELHGEGIRTKPGESSDLDLDALPTCS